MLASLRQKIDDIDQSIITLLEQRTKIVEEVGQLKSRTAHHGIIRAGREATMIRKLITQVDHFPKQAIADIWRLIISASLSIEHEFTVAAYVSGNEQDAYWLGREYFGAFTPSHKINSPTAIIEGVSAGKFAVGVLPLSDYISEEEKWWQTLGSFSPAVQIFAHLPFVINPPTNHRFIAIAKTAPEETGEDHTMLLIHSELGREHILSFFEEHHLRATQIAASHYFHLIEVEGFHDEKAVTALKKNGAIRITLLGAYANPLLF